MKKQFTVAPYWDARAIKNGMSRIMLTINHGGGNQFRFVVKLQSTKADFIKATTGNGGNERVRELRSAIQEQIAKAESILMKMEEPNKELFLNYFKTGSAVKIKKTSLDVYALFDEMIVALKVEERLGYAENVKGSRNSFRTFSPSLKLSAVNEDFLKRYKAWMLGKGCSMTTIQMYQRNLRTIYNKAVKDGLLLDVNQPFKNYSIGTTAKSKSVLYPPQIKSLYEYETTGIRASRAKDWWMFCYLCNGMNFKDACHLRYSNINGDMLSFVRQKTKRTNSVAEKEINVYLHPEILRIIEKWGNKPVKPNEYIFPVLSNAVGVEKQLEAFKRYRGVSNKMLRLIGQDLGLQVNLCLNLARHSFGTKLKLDGTSISFISDAMGHANSKTTEHYLKSIPDDKYKEMSSKLLEF